MDNVTFLIRERHLLLKSDIYNERETFIIKEAAIQADFLGGKLFGIAGK